MKQGDLFSSGTPRAIRRPELGRELGHAGAELAAAHADAVVANWGDRAFAYVCQYAEQHEHLTAEHAREFAEAAGLPKPPDRRSWGSVMLRARRERVVVKIGYATADDPKVHGSICTLWQSVRVRR